jgi:hypothetical protein
MATNRRDLEETAMDTPKPTRVTWRTATGAATVLAALGLGAAIGPVSAAGAVDTGQPATGGPDGAPGDQADSADGAEPSACILDEIFLDELTEEELAEIQAEIDDELIDDELIDDELTEEELTEIQAEVDAEKAALDEAGVVYTLVEDPWTGVAFPEPADDTAEAWEAFERVLIELWAAEFAALPEDERAAIIAEETEFAAELRSELDRDGISYQLEADPVTGVEFPVFDWDELEAGC